ncbi:hypothetical protein BC833DRAFT_418813 [Globomyces pollinis-pini]|nr:hypothetical protein BC833DRAFT_418813 [Globomyces pollinis-pini]
MSHLANLEAILDTCDNKGLAKVTMHGIVTLKINTKREITDSMIYNAIYRTILDFPRLSTVIIDSKTYPAGKTLEDLDLDCEISRITKCYSKDNLASMLFKDMNTAIKSPLGYRFRISVTGVNIVDGKPLVTLYIQTAMIHTLSDGMGTILVVQKLGKYLEESLHDNQLISKTATLNTEKVVPIEKYHPIVPSSVPAYYGLWILIFVQRFCIGLFFMLQSARNLLFYRSFSYSGSLDPSNVKCDNIQSPNGFRHLEMAPDIVEKLRLQAREVNGSIASVLIIASTLAYMSVVESNNVKLPKSYNLNFVVDSRRYCDDVAKGSLVQGSAFYPMPKYGYRLLDSDKFWDHVRAFKAIINYYLTYISPYIKVTSLFPYKLLALIFHLHKLNHKRDYPIAVSNLGSFTSEQLKLTKSIDIVDLMGSANTFWNANRHLFQVTSVTISGRMRLMVTYPTYLVSDTEADLFISQLNRVLHAVTTKNREVTCKEARA